MAFLLGDLGGLTYDSCLAAPHPASKFVFRRVEVGQKACPPHLPVTYIPPSNCYPTLRRLRICSLQPQKRAANFELLELRISGLKAPQRKREIYSTEYYGFCLSFEALSKARGWK